MDRAMTFFRVFDLAFFAPGAVIVLFVFLAYGQPIDSLQQGESVAFGLLTMVVLVLCAYVLGVAVLSMHRCLVQIWSSLRQSVLYCRASETVKKLKNKVVGRKSGDTQVSRRKRAVEPLILYLLEKDSRRQEILLYFWYLRATCWNLGLALYMCALASCVARPKWEPESRDYAAFWLLFLIAGLLYRQGNGYHETLISSIHADSPDTQE